MHQVLTLATLDQLCTSQCAVLFESLLTLPSAQHASVCSETPSFLSVAVRRLYDGLNNNVIAQLYLVLHQK